MQICVPVGWFFEEARCDSAFFREVDVAVEKIYFALGVLALEFYRVVGLVDFVKKSFEGFFSGGPD